MKKFEKLILFVLLSFVFIFMGACKKNPEIERNSDMVQLMYVRIYPVISPESDDPIAISMYNTYYGGVNFRITEKISENQWVTMEREVQYSSGPYMVSILDAKIMKEYTHIARKIFIRISGVTEWIELTCIKPHIGGSGEQAEFFINKEGISFPSY
jgi:hypothetical protein